VSATFAGQTGTYGLNLALIPASIVLTPGDEGGPLVNGNTNSATLNLGDLDVWSFIGTPGDSNVLRVTATDFTPRIRLYSSTGVLVGEANPNNSTFNRTATLSYEVTSENPGLYTVVISAAFAGQSGTYIFKQSRWAPDLIVPETQAIDES